MDGSCEYIEEALADSRQGVVLQLGVKRGANNSRRKKYLVSKRLNRSTCENVNEQLGFVKCGEFLD
jgi:hypothetical protein